MNISKTVWLFGAALLCMSYGSLAQDAPERSADDDALRITQCRIRLVHDVELASEQNGILEFSAAEGTKIAQGEVVAKVRDDVVRASLAIAEKQAANDVEVRYAAKATELAQLKYVRAVEANRANPGTVADLELGELRLMAEKSLLQLEQAKSESLLAGLRRDEAEARLRGYRVAAPFDAVVLRVFKQPGEVVREGEPVLELANTDWVRVEGHVHVEDAHLLHRNGPVRVVLETQGGPARAFRGTIGFVDVKVEPVSKAVRFWVTAENRGNQLKDGLVATVVVEPHEADRVTESRDGDDENVPRSTAAAVGSRGR
jgi:multidrug efflux pump subunit AcrA (membrane-fusion protein)